MSLVEVIEAFLGSLSREGECIVVAQGCPNGNLLGKTGWWEAWVFRHISTYCRCVQETQGRPHSLKFPVSLITVKVGMELF